VSFSIELMASSSGSARSSRRVRISAAVRSASAIESICHHLSEGGTISEPIRAFHCPDQTENGGSQVERIGRQTTARLTVTRTLARVLAWLCWRLTRWISPSRSRQNVAAFFRNPLPRSDSLSEGEDLLQILIGAHREESRFGSIALR